MSKDRPNVTFGYYDPWERVHTKLDELRHDLCELADRLDEHMHGCPPDEHDHIRYVHDGLGALTKRLDEHIATGGHAPTCTIELQCSSPKRPSREHEPPREWPKTLREVIDGGDGPILESIHPPWVLMQAVRRRLIRYGLLDAPIQKVHQWDGSHCAVIAVPWERDKDC